MKGPEFLVWPIQDLILMGRSFLLQWSLVRGLMGNMWFSEHWLKEKKF